MSKYNRTYHLPFSPGVTSDDRISKDISYLLNRRIIITEKIDGGNIGMNNSSLFERSHSQESNSPWTRKVKDLFNSNVKGKLDDDIFLFGEGVEAIHSIIYDKITTPFYLFGVRDGDKWLSWNFVEEYAYVYSLTLAPVLFNGIIKSEDELIYKIEELVSNGSMLGDVIEGVVVRSYDSFNDGTFNHNVSKWVRENHVKTDEHWSKNWIKAKINYM